MNKQEENFQKRALIAPDGETQWNLATIQLRNLIELKEKGDEKTKELVEWELHHRYILCVY